MVVLGHIRLAIVYAKKTKNKWRMIYELVSCLGRLENGIRLSHDPHSYSALDNNDYWRTAFEVNLNFDNRMSSLKRAVSEAQLDEIGWEAIRPQRNQSQPSFSRSYRAFWFLGEAG